MWHRQGKVNLTKGSDVVTGVGTNWVENIRVGDAFQGPDGKLYQVINVASNEALAISPSYEGNTATNLNYWIVPVPGYSKTQADRLSLIISKLDGDIVTATEAADRAQAAAQQAQQWRNEAAVSAATALQSEQNAALSADIAEQARDDAVAVVTGGTASIDPEAGKIPIAGAEASIKQGWIENLQFELDALRVAKNRLLYGDGPYPMLDFQFAGAKLLDPRIRFTRASEDYQNGDIYEINEPVLTDKGLWCSGKRANLLRGSGDMSKEPWSRGPQYFANVSNTSTPFRLYDTDFVVHYGPNVGQSSFTNHLPYQVVNLATAGKYTVSFYVKKVGLTTHLRLIPDNGSTTNQETTGGSVLLSGSGEDLDLVNSDTTMFSGTRSLKTIPAGDGWYKCILTFSTKIDEVSFRFRAFPYVGTTPLVGDGESGLLMSQVKLDEGEIDTGYIPTVDSQVTVANIGLEPIQTEGARTLFWEVELIPSISTSATVYFLSWGLNSSGSIPSNGLFLWSQMAGRLQPRVYSKASFTSLPDLRVDYREVRKIAVTVRDGVVAFSANGEYTESLTELPVHEYIKYANTTPTLTNQSKYRWIKSITVYRESMSREKMMELTAL